MIMKVLLCKDDYRPDRWLGPDKFPVIANPIGKDEPVKPPYIEMPYEEFLALKKEQQPAMDLFFEEKLIPFGNFNEYCLNLEKVPENDKEIWEKLCAVTYVDPSQIERPWNG